MAVPSPLPFQSELAKVAFEFDGLLLLFEVAFTVYFIAACFIDGALHPSLPTPKSTLSWRVL